MVGGGACCLEHGALAADVAGVGADGQLCGGPGAGGALAHGGVGVCQEAGVGVCQVVGVGVGAGRVTEVLPGLGEDVAHLVGDPVHLVG